MTYTYLFSKQFIQIISSRFIKLKNKLSLYFSYLIGPKDTWKKLNRCDVLLMCHDGDRGIMLNGRAYSPLIDSIGDDLISRGWNCESLALSTSFLVGDLAYNSPKSANRIINRNNILYRILKAILKYSYRPWYNKISKYNFLLIKSYSKIFKLTKCKCIFIIGARKEICITARIHKIKVVEVLHAMGYSPIPKKFSGADGGSIPWGFDKRETKALPDLILSFDPKSTKTFSVLTDLDVRIQEIPHPWLKLYDNFDNIPNEWKNDTSIRDKLKQTVLVTLSWSYDFDHPHYKGILSNGIIPESLVNLIKRTQNSVFWLIRLHPVQLRNKQYLHHIEYVETMVSNLQNCEWESSSNLPLPIVLKNCDCHISMDSMVCYEAAIYGKPSLLLCPTLKTGGFNELKFNDLKEEGYVLLGNINDDDNILEWITNSKSLKERHSISSNSWNGIVKYLLGSIRKIK